MRRSARQHDPDQHAQHTQASKLLTAPMHRIARVLVIKRTSCTGVGLCSLSAQGHGRPSRSKVRWACSQLPNMCRRRHARGRALTPLAYAAGALKGSSRAEQHAGAGILHCKYVRVPAISYNVWKWRCTYSPPFLADPSIANAMLFFSIAFGSSQ